jgi:hypothetical protein
MERQWDSWMLIARRLCSGYWTPWGRKIIGRSMEIVGQWVSRNGVDFAPVRQQSSGTEKQRGKGTLLH